MQNDPELNGKYMGTISSDFAKVSDTLKEASYEMRKRGISQHPVFPISKAEIKIGQLLVGQTEFVEPLAWHYYISMAEEFVQRGLIAQEQLPAFAANYRDADEYCCLFVVEPDFTNFVYIPYPED